jgi:hypothetical protein
MGAAAATVSVDPYRAGALGAVARMHGEYYAKHWGLARTFECRVARGLADLLEREGAGRDGFWTAAFSFGRLPASTPRARCTSVTDSGLSTNVPTRSGALR